MRYFLALAVMLVGSISISCAQQKPEKFKFCRVEIIDGDFGYVADVDGTFVFKADEIILKSNNEKPDVVYVIIKEVAPQLDIASHKAWLVAHPEYPAVTIIVERGLKDGVMMVDSTGGTGFFFSVDRKDDLQPLPEKNKWFSFPRGGGDLKKIGNY
jgi:hypothetical protein